MKRILVIGWYGHNNIGDETFQNVFRYLWPDVMFVFGDQVPTNVNEYDALIFGGGSFLDREIPSLVTPDFVTIPVGFVGVGIHSAIHLTVREWLAKAAIIVARNLGPWGKPLNSPGPILCAPDLFFGTEWRGVNWPISPPNSAPKLLVLGNDSVIPGRDEVRWRGDAWNWFASEFAAILDRDYKGWSIDFYPMCTSDSARGIARDDDRLFPAPIVAQVEERSAIRVFNEPVDLLTLTARIDRASLVISLRLHGVILSTIMGTPHVGICMHDKMVSYFTDRDWWKNRCNYYGFSSDTLRDAVAAMPTVDDMDARRKDGYQAWQNIAAIVAEKLFF
jgi:hypothetical protein